VVTRTREQAGGLSKRLGELGADVIELPTIRIEPPQDRKEFAESVAESHTYDWLIFTSPNGVERFFDAFYATYQDARSLGGCRIAAIGPSTESKIREYRFAVDLLPGNFVAEGLLEAFKKECVEHQKILWVKAEETRNVIYDGLMAQGAIVDLCLAYRTVPETADPTGAAKQLREEGADLITFTSGSTVENFFKMDLDWPEGCEAACIGPVTHETFKASCEAPSIESEKHDIEGLVQTILDHYAK